MKNKEINNISLIEWEGKYKEDYIKRHFVEDENLELFYLVLSELNILRVRILWNSGLSSFNKSHLKFIDNIQNEFNDYIKTKVLGRFGVKMKINENEKENEK